MTTDLHRCSCPECRPCSVCGESLRWEASYEGVHVGCWEEVETELRALEEEQELMP